MKILILASGGDCSGMNTTLYYLSKYFKGEIFVCYRGYEGLINGEISPIDKKLIFDNRFKGGVSIKTSRSASFMTKKGFDKAVKNLRENEIDKLIVMGGNGSFEGAKRLTKFVDVAFIPSTIDNDFEHSDYTIGFDTAIQMCSNYVNIVNDSLLSFDRIGIYEVMGRDCDNLAVEVGKVTNADLVIGEKEEISKLAKKINSRKNNPQIILIKEKMYNEDELKELFVLIKKDFRYNKVGYFQRGGNPTKNEINKCKNFAKCLAKNINNQSFVVVEEENNIKIKNI